MPPTTPSLTPSSFGIDPNAAPRSFAESLLTDGRGANASGPIWQRGNVVLFAYQFYRHDPNPLVLVTDILPGRRVRGLNLHMLSMPFIQALLRQHGGDRMMSYGKVKGDAYLASAFREYKWVGVQRPRALDMEFVKRLAQGTRGIDPGDKMAMRKAVADQAREMAGRQANAADLSGRAASHLASQPATPTSSASRPATVVAGSGGTQAGGAEA